MNESNAPTGRIRLYACGGTGINIVKNFVGFDPQRKYAEIIPCFLDTAKANLSGIEVDENNIYLIPEADGSGGNRRTNHSEINNRIRDMLKRFPPMDLNILVFSGAGGTGSVIGPLLAKALLEKGEPTVCIVVTAFEALKRAQNSIDTIKSLANISETIQQPVSVIIENNSGVNSSGAMLGGRQKVDESIAMTINAFALLFSGNHSELDSEDLKNWLFYPKVTPVAPGIAMIEIVTEENELDPEQYPISVASLLVSDSVVGDLGMEYHTYGKVKQENKDHVKMLGGQNMHMIISNAQIPQMMKRFNESLLELQSRTQARPVVDSLVSASDEVDAKSGLIL